MYRNIQPFKESTIVSVLVLERKDKQQDKEKEIGTLLIKKVKTLRFYCKKCQLVGKKVRNCNEFFAALLNV